MTWNTTPAALAVIAQITRSDFTFSLVRGIPYDSYQWRPLTGIGWAIEADLDDIRRAYVDRQAGFSVNEKTSADDMIRYLDHDRTQTSVQDVISAAVQREISPAWDNEIADHPPQAWRAA